VKKPSLESLPSAIKTTAELARYVGLSRSTVSRILNRRPGVKQKNVDRVMQVVERTGFAPNPYSRILRGQRSASIAVCLATFRHSTFVRKLDRVVQLLAKAGYTALIEISENIDHVALIRRIHRMRAEGVIFIGQHEQAGLVDHVRELAAAGIPHVFTDDSFGAGKVNVVTVDRARGMELAANHLFALGHRQIGIMGIFGVEPVEYARLEGLRRAVKARHLDPVEILININNPPSRESSMTFGREIALRFAAMTYMPTAFVALNDEIAFGALEGFRMAGIAVPAAASVVGFDNAEISRVALPSITTIDQRVDESVAAAVEFLLEQLRKKPVILARPRLLTPELVIRDSTGPAPARR
jgi:DNA-binding LacI/PurR family transcriptional regulator